MVVVCAFYGSARFRPERKVRRTLDWARTDYGWTAVSAAAGMKMPRQVKVVCACGREDEEGVTMMVSALSPATRMKMVASVRDVVQTERESLVHLLECLELRSRSAISSDDALLSPALPS